MALAWAARAVQAPVSSMPIQGAARKRPLETSWPACFSRASKRRASALSNSTIASVGVEPALVPPSTAMSTPSAPARSMSKPAATALASRAPSRWIFRPAALAGPVSAARSRLGVDRAVLGGVGQRERGGGLVVGDVGLGQGAGQRARVDPAGGAGQRDQADAGAEEARRAGLVGGDVAVLVAEHRLVRRGQGRQGQRVGGGAGGDEPHLGVGVQQLRGSGRRRARRHASAP